jgi:hypothetical protein
MTHLDEYERAMSGTRRGLYERRALTAALGGGLDARSFHAMLLQFCALGFQMTVDVERWIRQAGERCIDIGFGRLGRALTHHARSERGHQLLFVSDTRALVDLWNSRFSPPLEAEALLAQPATPGVVLYRELHEEVITSQRPYRQIAIEYEIERLSVGAGGNLLRAVQEQLGSDLAASLSFVEEHRRVDEGHTKFNALELARFLDEDPSSLPFLVEAGTRALEAYGSFLDDCIVEEGHEAN